MLVCCSKGNAQNAHRSRLTVAVLTVRATPSLFVRANLRLIAETPLQHFLLSCGLSCSIWPKGYE